MRLALRILAIVMLLVTGSWLSRCGTVTISNLDRSDFQTPTPTP